MVIINQAKRRLKSMHIDQWQDGYPNEEAVKNDIANKNGFVFLDNDKIIAYAAIIFDGEPTYQQIDGQWVTDNDYVVIHRIAVKDDYTHKGVAKRIFKVAEMKARHRNVPSFRIDTHHDNRFMRNLIRQNGFTLCGIIQVRDGKRLAYEKQISLFSAKK